MLDKLFCLYCSSAMYTGVRRSNLPAVLRDTLHPVPSTETAAPYQKKILNGGTSNTSTNYTEIVTAWVKDTENNG